MKHTAWALVNWALGFWCGTVLTAQWKPEVRERFLYWIDHTLTWQLFFACIGAVLTLVFIGGTLLVLADNARRAARARWGK